MFEVVLLAVFAVFLAWFDGIGESKYGLKTAFLLIFLFAGLRYNFGTDYMSYLEMFKDIERYKDVSDIDYSDYYSESLWLILCYLFKPFGFFSMIFVLSAFYCYTYYIIIKKYVNKKYYWFAVLIYICFTDLMLVQLSAIRQALSICIFIYSIQYLLEKRSIIKYIALCILAGSFHTSGFSMLLLLIFYPKYSDKNNKYGYIILLSFFGFILFGSNLLQYSPQVSAFLFGERYNYYVGESSNKQLTFIGTLFWSSYVFIVIYYSRFQSGFLKVIFYLCSLYFLMFPISNVIYLSNRLAYFYAPFCMITFPLILDYEKKILHKVGLFVLFFIFIFYNLNNFFKQDWVIQGYSKYETIFSRLF